MKTARAVDEYLGKIDVECSDVDWSRKKPRTISEAVQWPLPPQGTGKYTQFSDCVYKLPFYLAQYSLVSFDSNQAFENVIVLDTMRYMSDQQCATYLITFQATLSTHYDHESGNTRKTDYYPSSTDSEYSDDTPPSTDSYLSSSRDSESSGNQRSNDEGSGNERIDNVKTFQTKIFVSPLDPTTRIQIEYVWIKSSQFFYYWEHARENLDEFVPTHNQPRIVKVRNYFDDEDEEKEKLPDKDIEEKEKLPDKDIEEKEKLPDKDIEEEKLPDKDIEEKEKLPDKDIEEKPKIYSQFHNYFLPKPKDDDDQESNDYWDQVQRELEEEYKEGSEVSNQMEQYEIDVENSDGFDVGFYPLVTRGMILGNWVCRYYDLAEDDDFDTADLNRLVYLSQLAICVYNMKEGKDFDNVKVLLAMSFGTASKDLNITFEASPPGGTAVTFQTRIFTALCRSYKNIEIVFVRIKST